MPTLTVTSPVADRSLTSLAQVKAELGIAADDTASDPLLTGWIKDDSDAVLDACHWAPDQMGRRCALDEPVTISFRASEVPVNGCDPAPLLLPWRLPLSIDTVTVDGQALTVSEDVECQPMGALLYRLDASGQHARWRPSRIVITGRSGWTQDEVPAALRGAVLDLIRIRWDSQGRNSFVKRERVEDVGEREFWVGDQPNSTGGMPKSVLESLRAAGLVNIVIG